MRFPSDHDHDILFTPLRQSGVVSRRKHVAKLLDARQRIRLASEFGPHEEPPSVVINKLAVGDDVQAASKQDSRDVVDNSGLIRAINGQDVGLHGMKRRPDTAIPACATEKCAGPKAKLL